MITAREIASAFDRQETCSLGAEEELMLVSPATGDLLFEADRVLDVLQGDPRFKRELPSAQIESMTSPCGTVAELRDQLMRSRRELSAALDGTVGLAAAGAHPFAAPTGTLNRGSRYDAAVAQYGEAVLSHQLVYALQIHVAPGNAKTALAVYNGLRSYLPLIAALAANAPFHDGRDTGLASARPRISQLLPRQGIPPALATWDAFAADLSWASKGGLIVDPGGWWWELRPHPAFGTLELRVPDAQTTVVEAGAIAALSQCLVMWLGERHLQGDRLAIHASWRIAENSWLAARDGIDAELIDLDHGERVSVRDSIRGLLVELAPMASRLGCQSELALTSALAEKNGATRQREIAAERDLHRLVDWLASQLLEAPEPGRGSSIATDAALPGEWPHPDRWDVLPDADPRRLATIVRGAATELAIPVPDIGRFAVALPVDVRRVTAVLDRIDPEWGELICPPPA
jgi:carboxylate-amine ligase